MVTVEFVFVNLWQRLQVPNTNLHSSSVWGRSL